MVIADHFCIVTYILLFVNIDDGAIIHHLLSDCYWKTACILIKINKDEARKPYRLYSIRAT
jgi:hypothetical protein